MREHRVSLNTQGEISQMSSVTRVNKYLNIYLERLPKKTSVHEPPSVSLLDSMFAYVASEVKEGTRSESVVDIYRSIANVLPGTISNTVQRAALDAVASSDPDTKQIGKRVFFFLNLKSVVSAISLYLVDNPHDSDEMMQRTVAAVYEKIDGIDPEKSIHTQIHEVVKADVGLASVARDMGMPTQWVKSRSHRPILTIVDAALERNPDGLDSQQIAVVAQSLSRKTGYTAAELKGFVEDRNTIFMGGVEEPTDLTSSTVIDRHQKAEIEKVLAELPEVQRQVIQMKYLGISGEKGMTHVEIGAELGKSWEKIRQIDTQTVHELGKNKRLRSYWKAK